MRLLNYYIIGVILFLFSNNSGAQTYDSSTRNNTIAFRFFGDSINTSVQQFDTVTFNQSINTHSIRQFYNTIKNTDYEIVIAALQQFQQKNQLDDWLLYQLVRKTAQHISPKQKNYNQYTLYKWFILGELGYDVRLASRDSMLVFYVKSEENIYDIPYFMEGNYTYVCLNYHDLGYANFKEKEPLLLPLTMPSAKLSFSYKITHVPEFDDEAYTHKSISFEYKDKAYHFDIVVNSSMNAIFKNYPVVDYEAYFNIPLSYKTYSSLIPALQKVLKGKKQKDGVDYLMRFTRNAFAYDNDQALYGKEKRLSPELTLLTPFSDCDDRAALFFYLVKEIYQLPMIVLAYPSHVTIAVKFDKPIGKHTIAYKNQQYSVCEPTPQSEDLNIGEISSQLQHQPYHIAYEYNPIP
jgi:hypothetical protein